MELKFVLKNANMNENYLKGEDIEGEPFTSQASAGQIRGAPDEEKTRRPNDAMRQDFRHHLNHLVMNGWLGEAGLLQPAAD